MAGWIAGAKRRALSSTDWNPSIMNFELNKLDLAAAASEKCDALLVLVSAEACAGKDALSTLVNQAVKSGDLETKAGKLLQVYRAPGLACTRAVLVGAGDGSARQIRQAVAAAVGALKSSTVKRLVVCFAQTPTDDGVRAALLS